MILTRSLEALYSATIDRSKFRETAQRVLVFALPFFYWGHERKWWGFGFVASGVLIRAWAAGSLRKDQQLAATGPYLVARHPLYLGSCLLALGLIVTLNHWLAALLLGGATALTYLHTIEHEERNLLARFGAAYAEHCRRVGPLWPRWAGLRLLATSRGAFSITQYFRNKEWECLLGVAVVALVLYLGSP